MTDNTPRTMAEALEEIADADEQAALSMLPQLAFLLGDEASEDEERFQVQQVAILDAANHIQLRRANAAGIRAVLKLGEEAGL